MTTESPIPVVRKSDDMYYIEDFDYGNCVLSVTYLHHGQSTKGHSHDNAEAYYVAQGQGEMELGSNKRRLLTGDFVYVDRGVFHRVRNCGVVTLVVVCCWEKQK